MGLGRTRSAARSAFDRCLLARGLGDRSEGFQLGLDAAGQVSFVGSTALGELPSDDLEMSPSGHFLFYPSRVTSTLVARPINSDGSLGAPVSSSTVNQANGVEVLP